MSLPDNTSDCDASPSIEIEREVPVSSFRCTAFRTFPRSARLLTAGDYGQVFKQNKRYSDHYWTILVRRDGVRPARLGLAIAKKRAKRAVDRNKLKRIVREAFRLQQAPLLGCDMVVMNRDAAAKASSKQLRASFDTLLNKISVRTSTQTTSVKSATEPASDRKVDAS